MARTWGRKGRPYRRAQAQCFAEETDCYFGDGPVDQTLANVRSPRARSVHHLVPPDLAPELANDRANMRLAHLGCNAKYGRGAFTGVGAKGTTPATWGHAKGPATVGGSTGGRAQQGAGWTPERDW